MCQINNRCRGESAGSRWGESILIDDSDDPLPTFHPEFGRFMLEATPGKPWGIGFKDLLDVEPNMRRRLVPDSPSRLHGVE